MYEKNVSETKPKRFANEHWTFAPEVINYVAH